jgi:hypothetical protein
MGSHSAAREDSGRWFLRRLDVDDDPLAALTTRAFLRSARRITRRRGRDLDRERPTSSCCSTGSSFESTCGARDHRRRHLRAGVRARPGVQPTRPGVYDFGATTGSYDSTRRRRPARRTSSSVAAAPTTSSDLADRDWNRIRRRWQLFTNLTWDTAVLERDLASTTSTWLDAAEHSAIALRPSRDPSPPERAPPAR